MTNYMGKFYIFKITLSYFDDEQKTFFLTPEQSEADEMGVQFSEFDLQDTSEFKDFVNMTGADVIDVDYIEYAVENDPKISDIINAPITEDSFAELEKSELLKVINKNQIILVSKKKKSRNGSKVPILLGAWIAAVVGFFLVAVAFAGLLRLTA